MPKAEKNLAFRVLCYFEKWYNDLSDVADKGRSPEKQEEHDG